MLYVNILISKQTTDAQNSSLLYTNIPVGAISVWLKWQGDEAFNHVHLVLSLRMHGTSHVLL